MRSGNVNRKQLASILGFVGIHQTKKLTRIPLNKEHFLRPVFLPNNKLHLQSFWKPTRRLVSVQNRLVSVQNRLVSVQNRLVSVQNRLLSVQNRLVSVQNLNMFTFRSYESTESLADHQKTGNVLSNQSFTTSFRDWSKSLVFFQFCCPTSWNQICINWSTPSTLNLTVFH